MLLEIICTIIFVAFIVYILVGAYLTITNREEILEKNYDAMAKDSPELVAGYNDMPYATRKVLNFFFLCMVALSWPYMYDYVGY